MDDFEEFRKKRAEQKQQQAEAEASEKAQDESLGWVEGIGPKGPTNPKVKGFILGRYWSPKKIDPSTLKRPAGYESTSLAPEQKPGTEREPSEESQDEEKKPEIKGFQRW